MQLDLVRAPGDPHRGARLFVHARPLDQLLLPFYEADRKAGRLDDAAGRPAGRELRAEDVRQQLLGPRAPFDARALSWAARRPTAAI